MIHLRKVLYIIVWESNWRDLKCSLIGSAWTKMNMRHKSLVVLHTSDLHAAIGKEYTEMQFHVVVSMLMLWASWCWPSKDSNLFLKKFPSSIRLRHWDAVLYSFYKIWLWRFPLWNPKYGDTRRYLNTEIVKQQTIFGMEYLFLLKVSICKVLGVYMFPYRFIFLVWHFCS